MRTMICAAGPRPVAAVQPPAHVPPSPQHLAAAAAVLEAVAPTCVKGACAPKRVCVKGDCKNCLCGRRPPSK